MEISHYQILASYFESKDMYLDRPYDRKPNVRKLVELPWQQTNGELWEKVTNTLCNLDFIQAKAAAKLTYDLVNDYILALDVIPDNQNTILEEKARKARMDKYSKDLIAFAKGEIKDLEIPESITPWSEERIEEEIRRIKINPNLADKLKDFSYFIGSRAVILQKYAGEFPHHVHQQAWNYANDGPVSGSVENADPEILKTLLLCDRQSRPDWNPLPFAQKTILYDRTTGGPIVILPDGSQAIQGADQYCIHWDLSLGKIIKKMEGDRSKTKVQFYGGSWGYPFIEEHNGANKVLSVTPDGKTVISGNQKTCLIWDISSGKVIKNLKGHTAAVNAVSITPDSSRAISGSDDKICIIWDLRTEGKYKILEGHSSKVISVAISTDGKWALSASDTHLDKPIIWDVEKGEKAGVLETKSEGILYKIQSVYITPDGKTALCFGYDCLEFFDLGSRKLLRTTYNIPMYGLAKVSVAADARRGLFNFGRNECVLLDLITGERIFTLTGHKTSVGSIAITPDGRYGVSSSGDKTIIFWDLEKGKEINESKQQKLSSLNISITPDGKLAFAGGNLNGNASCRLMDLETMELKHEIFATPDRINPPYFTIYHYAVNNVAITSNGQIGISGITDYNNPLLPNTSDKHLHTINVYDLAAGRIVRQLIGHNGSIRKVSITEDGRNAVSSSEDESCILWDLATGKWLKSFIGHEFNVKPLVRGQGRVVDEICFAPDGQLVIFSTIYAGCKIWNLRTGKTEPITPPMGKAVSVTPDGKWVISIHSIPVSSTVDSIVVWNLKTGKESKVIKDYSKGLFSVSVSPDGTRAVTVSSDGMCFLIDIENGRILSDHISAFGKYSVKYLPQGIFYSNQYDDFGFLHSDKKMLCPGIAIATIKQIWDFSKSTYTAPLVYCPLCGHCFEPRREITGTIIQILKDSGIQPDQSPCLELPDEAWEHPGLTGECPSCHEKIKFNPFFGSDPKGIQDYKEHKEYDLKYQKILDDADEAFKEGNWEKAYSLYLKLVQQGKFDLNQLRFNIAVCRIKGMVIYNQDIVSDIEYLIKLLSEKGAAEKAESIASQLKQRIDTLKNEESEKKNSGKPWWKRRI